MTTYSARPTDSASTASCSGSMLRAPAASRIDFSNSKILQEFVKRLNATSAAVPKGTLPPGLANLVLTRASQINGCAVCVDMHTKDAEHDGETSVRLNLVAAWLDANVFTDAERAALELTEQATRIADAAGGVTDEAWRTRPSTTTPTSSPRW